MRSRRSGFFALSEKKTGTDNQDYRYQWENAAILGSSRKQKCNAPSQIKLSLAQIYHKFYIFPETF